jgi:hypothetical protein
VFGPCILNLLVKFVSSCLESIKLQMPLMEMKMSYYCGPLDNPSWGQPWCCGPLHHPLSAGSSHWIDFLVLIPNSSWGNHLGGWELKDGLQEVPKGNNWPIYLLPRKYLSAHLPVLSFSEWTQEPWTPENSCMCHLYIMWTYILQIYICQFTMI